MRASLLEFVTPGVCPACDTRREEGETLLCGGCRARLSPLDSLRGVHTALAYEGRAAELIRRFKFEQRSDALAVLLEPLACRVAHLCYDGIVPIPRHWSRIRELGCDPGYELARALARRVKKPLWTRLLWRSRPTPPQTGLGVEARRRNVAGSFRVRSGALRGSRALLLDDVTTTGATLREAARVLRLRGRASAVVAAAIAGRRAGLPSLGTDAPRTL